jgi:lauroyl/myristoyl acyltransferase
VKKELKNLMEWLLWFPGQALLDTVWGDRLPYGLAVIVGKLQFLCARSRVKGLRRELSKLAGTANLSQDRLNAVIARSMILDAVDQLEILSYPKFGAHASGKRLTLATIHSIDGLEHLDAALAKGGVILAHLHFGAMQMVLPALAHRGYPIAQVGNSRLSVFDDPASRRSPLFKTVLEKQKHFEESLPVRFLYTGSATREIVKWLKAGNIVDLAIDGRTGSKWIETEFLGRKANFADNPFRLARLTNASLLPTFVIRRPDDFSLRVVIKEQIPKVDGEEKASHKKMLRYFLELAEGYFSIYPCHFCRRLRVMQRQKPHLSQPIFFD